MMRVGALTPTLESYLIYFSAIRSKIPTVKSASI